MMAQFGLPAVISMCCTAVNFAPASYWGHTGTFSLPPCEVYVLSSSLITLPRVGRGLAAAALALTLTGCGSFISELPVVGLPEGAPARPADPGAFPAVHDIPAPRGEATLDPAAQEKIERELTAARDRHSAAQK